LFGCGYKLYLTQLWHVIRVQLFDFYDTYLPQYKRVFTEANAAGAMCSYAAENGVPSCDNSWLLTKTLRGDWNRSDAYITTDCGVMRNNMGPPLNLKTPEESCAAAINAGTDLEMGTAVWNASMLSAVQKGLVTEETVSAAAYRGILQRMRQGDFDPVLPPPPPRNCSTASEVEGADTQFGTYLPGSPMTLNGTNGTADHCKSLCCASEDCDAYTFATQTATNTKECWLKSCPSHACPSLQKSCSNGYVCTSGIMQGTCTGTPTVNMDTNGEGISGYSPKELKTTTEMSAEHCQALCCAVGGCNAYTYVLGQSAPGTAECWLKTGGQLVNSSACAAGSALNCTSGVVSGAGHGAAPAPPEPAQVVSWSDIDINIVGSEAHEEINYQATLQSLVLLKNVKQALPLTGGQKIAVVGPAAIAQYGKLLAIRKKSRSLHLRTALKHVQVCLATTSGTMYATTQMRARTRARTRKRSGIASPRSVQPLRPTMSHQVVTQRPQRSSLVWRFLAQPTQAVSPLH
jgi:beta-glucosidase-like glycosyl hydrolase